jgi:hypothetical protein
MDINKIVSIIRTLKEDGMTTGSSGAVAGYSANSPAEGPNAGTTYPINKGRGGNQIKLPKGSRKPWLDWLQRRNPQP